MDIDSATSILRTFVLNDSRFSFLSKNDGLAAVGRVRREMLFDDARVGIVSVDDGISEFGIRVTITSRAISVFIDESFDAWSLGKAKHFEALNILLTEEFEVTHKTLNLSVNLFPIAVGPKSISQTLENLKTEMIRLEDEIASKFQHEFERHL